MCLADGPCCAACLAISTVVSRDRDARQKSGASRHAPTKFLRHVNAIKACACPHDGRAPVARRDRHRTGELTRATIGNAATALVDAGYIAEGETNPTEGPRVAPASPSLNPGAPYFIGIDIGNAGADRCGHRPAHAGRRPHRRTDRPSFRDADYMLERLLELLERLIGAARIDTTGIEGLCVSVPGLVARDGSVVNAPFLEWRDYPCAATLNACPDGWMVTVCNDAFALASAEASGSARRRPTARFWSR